MGICLSVSHEITRELSRSENVLSSCAVKKNTKNKNEKVKDRKLFAKMCEGTDSFQKKQYILRWLVEGSMEFYLNGGELLPSPPCCEKYKIQHIKNNDWLSFFEFTDNKKDFMSKYLFFVFF